MHPHHSHDHRVWVVPDTSLGRWASFVFVVSASVAIAAPVVAWAANEIAEHDTGTPWFFAAWGSALVAIVVAIVAAGISAIALVRDHAVLLLVPVAVAFVALSALVTTNGVLN
jgi:amino acid transporter